MLIYKFNPTELSEKGEEPNIKQWNKNVKKRSTTTCKNDLDWSLVPQNANPKNIYKNEKVKHRRTHNGDIAMQLVIHTTDMCNKVHPCLVACVFYRDVSSNKLLYRYQYNAQEFLKKSFHSNKEMSTIPPNNNNTLSNIRQEQQNNDPNENDQMNKYHSNNSKKPKQSEHK